MHLKGPTFIPVLRDSRSQLSEFAIRMSTNPCLQFTFLQWVCMRIKNVQLTKKRRGNLKIVGVELLWVFFFFSQIGQIFLFQNYSGYTGLHPDQKSY